MTLIDNVPDAVSGHLLTSHDRLRGVVELTVPAEELWFASFFRSSAATPLGSVAAAERVR
ncbi:hypothetical protein ACTPOK_33660 [Streptomyces inhibens]|uniref:hypothetical protein n=1 Tax=Streptomyces inhibens TaxID=2293571 RepID=UPI00402AAEC6